MHKVVVVEKKRPSIPNRWSQSEVKCVVLKRIVNFTCSKWTQLRNVIIPLLQVFNTLSKIIQECWHDCSEARMTALRVKKSLTNVQVSLKAEKEKNGDKM